MSKKLKIGDFVEYKESLCGPSLGDLNAEIWGFKTLSTGEKIAILDDGRWEKIEDLLEINGDGSE